MAFWKRISKRNDGGDINNNNNVGNGGVVDSGGGYGGNGNGGEDWLYDEAGTGGGQEPTPTSPPPPPTTPSSSLDEMFLFSTTSSNDTTTDLHASYTSSSPQSSSASVTKPKIGLLETTKKKVASSKEDSRPPMDTNNNGGRNTKRLKLMIASTCILALLLGITFGIISFKLLREGDKFTNNKNNNGDDDNVVGDDNDGEQQQPSESSLSPWLPMPTPNPNPTSSPTTLQPTSSPTTKTTANPTTTEETEQPLPVNQVLNLPAIGDTIFLLLDDFSSSKEEEGNIAGDSGAVVNETFGSEPTLTVSTVSPRSNILLSFDASMLLSMLQPTTVTPLPVVINETFDNEVDSNFTSGNGNIFDTATIAVAEAATTTTTISVVRNNIMTTETVVVATPETRSLMLIIDNVTSLGEEEDGNATSYYNYTSEEDIIPQGVQATLRLVVTSRIGTLSMLQVVPVVLTPSFNAKNVTDEIDSEGNGELQTDKNETLDEDVTNSSSTTDSQRSRLLLDDQPNLHRRMGVTDDKVSKMRKRKDSLVSRQQKKNLPKVNYAIDPSSKSKFLALGDSSSFVDLESLSSDDISSMLKVIDGVNPVIFSVTSSNTYDYGNVTITGGDNITRSDTNSTNDVIESENATTTTTTTSEYDFVVIEVDISDLVNDLINSKSGDLVVEAINDGIFFLMIEPAVFDIGINDGEEINTDTDNENFDEFGSISFRSREFINGGGEDSTGIISGPEIIVTISPPASIDDDNDNGNDDTTTEKDDGRNGSSILEGDENEYVTTFCAIADVPYTPQEEIEIKKQLATQTEGCDFLIHLGDIMSSEDECNPEKYDTMSDILLENSNIPTFIVVGDNEWNDCGNETQIDDAWDLWMDTFLYFEENWINNGDDDENGTSFDFPEIIRQQSHEENFYFIYKRTIYVALTLPGGEVHDDKEWKQRQRDEYNWLTHKVINDKNIPSKANSIVIMAHAKPTKDHRFFFDPFVDFVQNVLNEYATIPILYLHGDDHFFQVESNYEGLANLYRIQHEGGTRNPVLKIQVNATAAAESSSTSLNINNVFRYDRQLDRKSTRLNSSHLA